VGRFDLWFARILRLTGAAMLVGFILALVLASVLSYDTDPSPEAQSLFGITVIVGIVMGFLGIPLSLIGDKISPPDPWLDPWLNPFRGRKRIQVNPHKEESEETED